MSEEETLPQPSVRDVIGQAVVDYASGQAEEKLKELMGLDPEVEAQLRLVAPVTGMPLSDGGVVDLIDRAIVI